jgi:hypothetical protein
MVRRLSRSGGAGDEEQPGDIIAACQHLATLAHDPAAGPEVWTPATRKGDQQQDLRGDQHLDAPIDAHGDQDAGTGQTERQCGGQLVAHAPAVLEQPLVDVVQTPDEGRAARQNGPGPDAIENVAESGNKGQLKALIVTRVFLIAQGRAHPVRLIHRR